MVSQQKRFMNEYQKTFGDNSLAISDFLVVPLHLHWTAKQPSFLKSVHTMQEQGLPNSNHPYNIYPYL